MSSTGNIFRHGALFSFCTNRLFIRLLSAVPAVLLTAVFFFSSAVPSYACLAKIVWIKNIDHKEFLETGSKNITYKWEVQNKSSCEAVDYRLIFHDSVPVSSTADFGGDINPSFSLKPNEKGIIQATIPKAPEEVGTKFDVNFDILEADGTPLPVLPLGRLDAVFTVTVPPTTLIYPEDKSTIDTTTPILEWKPVTGATGYRVVVSTNEDFTGLYDGKTASDTVCLDDSCQMDKVSSTTYQTGTKIILETEKTYYWKVRDSASGQWSAPFSFTVSTGDDPPPDCTPSIEWSEPRFDAGILDLGASAKFLWAITNTSPDCKAKDYYLKFKSADPDSSTASYGGGIPFDVEPDGGTTLAEANAIAPQEEGTYKVIFDVYSNKDELVPPPAGVDSLYAVFDVKKGVVPPPIDPCAGVLAPTVQNARLIQLGEGKVLVVAEVTGDPDKLTVTLKLNGKEYTMERLASGAYGAEGEGNETGKNDYTVSAGNGCKFHELVFVDGVLDSYNTGVCCQDALQSCENLRKCGRNQFAAAKGHPVSTWNGNFAEMVTDGAVAGIGDADLFISRAYNSASALADPASIYEYTESGRTKVAGPPQYFGTGWSSNLDSFLLKLDYAPLYEGVQIRFPDGHTQNFDKNGGSYEPSTPDNFDVLTEQGGEFVLDRKNDLEKWRFGADGKLQEIQDRNGNTVKYSYAGGLLEKISDGKRAVTFKHDGEGHITEAQLPENITISYQYDGELLTAVTDGRGNTTQYTYDENKQLTKITDPLGNPSVQMSYDDRYRVSRQTVGESELYAFAYQGEDAAEATTITDSYGNATIQKHDEDGRETETVHPDGTTEKFEHDEHNNRTYYKDPAGGEYRYTYDVRGNMLSLDGPLGLHKKWDYNLKNLVTLKTEKVDENKDRSFTFEYDENGNLSKFCLPLGDCGAISYDSHGLPLQMTDLRGNTTMNEYDSEGDLVSVTDPEGAKTQFEHDGLGRVTGKTKPLGNSYRYTYDQNSNLTAVDGPLGFHISYSYDPNDNLSQSTDPNGGQINYSYTKSGNPETVTNQLGFVTSFTYGLMNERTGKTDAEGRKWSYVYSNMLRVTDINGPLGWHQGLVYNPLGLVVESTDPEGRIKHIEYDALGRPLSVTKNYVAGGAEDSDTNVTTSFTYDLLGNRLSVKDPEGYEFTAEYDLQKRLVKRRDAENYEWEYSYDPMGNLLAELNPRGFSETYAYSPANRLQSVTNPEGHSKNIAWNANGKLESITDPMGIITAYGYNQLDRKVSKIRNYRPSFAPDNQTNVTTKYEYDLAGNLRFVTNPLNHKAEIRYDKAQRKTEAVDFEGGVTRFAYDKVDNLLKVTDAEGNATTYTVDDLDRLVSVTNAEHETTGYAYDLAGNRTKLIEPDNTVTLYEFDGVYRLNKVHENYRPDQEAGDDVNVLTQYSYDRRGLLTGFINANGAKTLFEHNGVEKLTKETDPLGMVWEYGYDGNRNRTARTDAKGDQTEYGFYPDDMLEQISYADGTTVSYEYDPNNNRTGMTDKLGKTSWSFDPLNRATEQKDPFERVLAYDYDADSNRTGMTYPDGNQVAYEYSPNSWLKRMTDPKGQAIKYSRDLVGNITKIVNPNKTLTTVSYDKVYRTLERINRQTTKGGKINSAYKYTYNELGHITETVNQYGWRKPSLVTETYGYDGLHRLTDFALFPLKNKGRGRSLQTYYSYDSAGNRLSWETSDDLQTNTPDDGFFRTYEYNDANQMLGMTHDANKKNKDYAYKYSYDQNGNRINRQLVDAHGPQYGVDYSYDPENRLVLAQDYQIVGSGKKGGHRIDRAFTTLEYDGGGRKLVQHYDPKQGGNGVDKRDEYVFDGLDPVAEYDMLNGQRSDYYRGAGGHIALMHQYKGGTRGQMYWYHYNNKGDVVGLTKQNGNSHHNYRYDPYGAVLPENGNFTDPHNHYTLTGKEFDENTGLVWFGARYYEPETGVWMGQDVYRGRLDSPMSLHRYGYVGNNPVNGWDYYGYTTAGAIIYNFFNGDSKVWVMKEDDPYTEIVRNFDSVQKEMKKIKEQVYSELADWKKNHMTNKKWSPKCVPYSSIDTSSFDANSGIRDGVNIESSYAEAVLYYLIYKFIDNDFSQEDVIGSYTIFVTLDSVDGYEVTLNIWMYNAMTKESLDKGGGHGFFQDIMLDIGIDDDDTLSAQYMWWNWKETFNIFDYRYLDDEIEYKKFKEKYFK